MAKLLVNDKGVNEDDACEYFCGPGDVASWGRLHVNYRSAVGDLVTNEELSEETRTKADAWFRESERFDKTASPGLGFKLASEFGPISNSELIDKTIDSIKKGRAFVVAMREELGESGGEEVTGSDNKDLVTEKEESRAKGFKQMVGAVLFAGVTIALGREAIKRFDD